MTVEVTTARTSSVDQPAIARYAEAVLRREGLEHDASLQITFVDGDLMSTLNAEHMGKDGATDVLSFPIEDALPGLPPRKLPDGPPLELGDIFICEDIVEAHASEHDVTFDSELHLMVTHGVLHILGWDHQTEAEAEAMETREAEHLQTIGMGRR